MVVSNNKYELPLFVADTYEEMAEWLKGMGVNACKNSFRKSATGIVRAANHKCKYLRIDRRTGKVIIGADVQMHRKPRNKADD